MIIQLTATIDQAKWQAITLYLMSKNLHAEVR